jgi:hypothetical protein
MERHRVRSAYLHILIPQVLASPLPFFLLVINCPMYLEEAEYSFDHSQGDTGVKSNVSRLEK